MSSDVSKVKRSFISLKIKVISWKTTRNRPSHFLFFTQFGVSFLLTSLLFTTNRVVKISQVRTGQPKLVSICFRGDRTSWGFIVLYSTFHWLKKKIGICWNLFCFVIGQLCLCDPNSSHGISEILKYLLQIYKSKFVCCIKGNLPDRTICLGSHRQIYKNSFGVKIIQWTSGFHALSQQNQVWATFQEIWYKGLLRLNVLIEEKFSFRRRERLTVSRNDNLQEDVLKSWQNICSIQTTRRGKHVCTS